MAATDTAFLSTYGPNLMMVGAVLLSALIAGRVALSVSRKRAAHDLAWEFLRSEMEKARAIFLTRCKEDRWRKLLKAKGGKRASDRRVIMGYLNKYELMAVSIRQRVIDESVLKAIIGDRLVKRYEQAYPLINLVRTQSGDMEFFEHFEFIAKRWRSDPSVPRQGRLRTAIRAIIGY